MRHKLVSTLPEPVYSLEFVTPILILIIIVNRKRGKQSFKPVAHFKIV